MNIYYCKLLKTTILVGSLSITYLFISKNRMFKYKISKANVNFKPSTLGDKKSLSYAG